MDLPFGFGRFTDEYWESYPGAVNIHPFGSQPHASPQGYPLQRHPGHGPLSQIDPSQGQPRYQYWPPQWLEACAQSQGAVMVNGASIHAQKQTEPKPRLSKEEVESLEKEFAKNPKPNSNIKRDLAERLAVEIPRINNWFQNRRAKEKQIKKTREFEAQQARERAASESKSSGDDESDVVSEFYGLANYHQPAGPSSATMGDENEEEEQEKDGEEGWGCEESEQEEEEKNEHETSGFSAEVDGNEIGSETEEAAVELTPRRHESDSSRHSKMDNGVDQSGYPPLLPTGSQDAADVTRNGFHAIDAQPGFQSPPENPYNLSGQPQLTGTSPSVMGDIVSAQTDVITNAITFEDLQTSEFFGNPSINPFLSGAVADGLQDQPMASIEPHQPCDHLEKDIKVEHLSPASMSHSPRPLTAQRFKSPPPPTDIAARRNLRRPPSLGPNSLRSFSHSQGPKTCIDVSRRPDVAPPMRRMTSSSVGMPGRIQKCGPMPRSSFSLERNRAALLHTLQGCGSPGLASLSSALSPLSPQGLALGENTTQANGSDEDLGFALRPFAASCSANMEQHPMRTPPATPGLSSNFPEPMFYFQLDQHWSSAPQDEPLQTPSLGSHGGSEFEFPGYVVSQPATPSLPMFIGPAHELHGKGPSNVEYAFPDSFPGYSTRSSPGQSKSQQFQFAQNVTPQDFNVER